MQTKLLAAAGAMCCAAALAAPARADSPNIRVVLAVSRDAATLGSCPTTFNFTGKLYATNWPATGARRVTYRFVRNDGASDHIHTANFDSPNQEDVLVKDTWTLSVDGYHGWEAVEVLTPRHLVFEKVPFTLTCA